jgi:DNA mismatch repair protein MutS2
MMFEDAGELCAADDHERKHDTNVMTFGPGESVHVAALGRGIVREVRNGGRYLVEIKGRSLVVEGNQLEPARSARTARAKPSVADTPGAPALEPTARATPSLDLHGRTVDESLDALDAFLNTALLAGNAEVRIIHGRSGGRLKAAVHARLKLMPSIRGFRIDPRNPGVTIVRL